MVGLEYWSGFRRCILYGCFGVKSISEGGKLCADSIWKQSRAMAARPHVSAWNTVAAECAAEVFTSLHTGSRELMKTPRHFTLTHFLHFPRPSKLAPQCHIQTVTQTLARGQRTAACKKQVTMRGEGHQSKISMIQYQSLLKTVMGKG